MRLDYDDNLKNFIELLYSYDIIDNYKYYPNAIEIEQGKENILIIFQEGGHDIETIRHTHTEITTTRHNEEDVLNFVEKMVSTKIENEEES